MPPNPFAVAASTTSLSRVPARVGGPALRAPSAVALAARGLPRSQAGFRVLPPPNTVAVPAGLRSHRPARLAGLRPVAMLMSLLAERQERGLPRRENQENAANAENAAKREGRTVNVQVRDEYRGYEGAQLQRELKQTDHHVARHDRLKAVAHDERLAQAQVPGEAPNPYAGPAQERSPGVPVGTVPQTQQEQSSSVGGRRRSAGPYRAGSLHR